MQIIQTQDGSHSAYSPVYEQQYHSRAGALQEARRVYVEPCQLVQKAKENRAISILDIGFGLGYNVFCALYEIQRINPTCRVHIESLESDKSVLLFDHYPEELKSLTRKIKSEWKRQNDTIVYQDKLVSLRIHLGDGRKKMAQIQGDFDAIFLDPFSPKKNPELWTVDYFRLLEKRLKEEGRIATYSVATPVLVGFIEAGLYPQLASGTDTKQYSLVVSKDENDRLPPKFYEKFKISTERIPYRDPTLSDIPEVIFERREKEKRLL